jgi:hypothetical protein
MRPSNGGRVSLKCVGTTMCQTELLGTLTRSWAPGRRAIERLCTTPTVSDGKKDALFDFAGNESVVLISPSGTTGTSEYSAPRSGNTNSSKKVFSHGEQNDWHGKVVAIIGASSGIGRWIDDAAAMTRLGQHRCCINRIRKVFLDHFYFFWNRFSRIRKEMHELGPITVLRRVPLLRDDPVAHLMPTYCRS